MIADQDYFWFRLFQTSGIGPKNLVSIARIMEKEKISSGEIPLSKAELSSRFPNLAKIILNKIRKEDQENIYLEYQSLLQDDVRIIHPEYFDYPKKFLNLAENNSISPVLFGKGNLKLLRDERVAIVGARNVSEQGIKATRHLATELAHNGINIISGYAKGVDSEAHLSALNAEGTTTLVLSYGIKEFRYKKEFNGANWERDTLAISQFSPKTKWIARNAMIRNKLICALAKGVIVIESGLEKDATGKMSGTFNTGITALKMQLPLFVISPNYFDIPPEGNNTLIEQGGIEINPLSDVQKISQSISHPISALIPDKKKYLPSQTELFSSEVFQAKG